MAFPKRDEVISHILETQPVDATLPTIVEALCLLQLEKSPEYIREWLHELADELEPAELVAGLRLPAVPSRSEVEMLVAAPDNDRDRLIFRTLYATGIRVGELAALTFADLDYEARTLLIRSGKDDIDRYAVADVETMRALRARQGDQPASGSVFGLGVSGIQKMMAKWGQQTGLLQKYEAMGRRLSPHSFRHAFATHLYENGCDLLALKHLLGHQFLSTTEMYIHTAAGRWRSAYAAAHPWGAMS